MGSGEVADERSTISPEEAFEILGSETRLGILDALARADGPVRFSELQEAIGYETASNFSYHLSRVSDHFATKTDDGYVISSNGRRIVEAIRSGAVTESVELDATPIEQSCHFCGAPIVIKYREESIERYCTECEGMWEGEPDGYLGSLSLPPVGFAGRTVTEATRSAWILQLLEILSIANRICPRCSGVIEMTLTVCESHENESGLCETCNARYAANIHLGCMNCAFAKRGALPLVTVTELALMTFLVDHGLHPVSPDSISEYHQLISDFEETVVSIDPVLIHLTFSANDDQVTFEIDESLAVRVVDDEEG